MGVGKSRRGCEASKLVANALFESQNVIATTGYVPYAEFLGVYTEADLKDGHKCVLMALRATIPSLQKEILVV
jgi:hypothetical protein